VVVRILANLNILFVQHGDYAEAYRRFASGGPETYRDQRHSVDFVASLATNNTVTTVAICEKEHDIELAPRLRSVGVLREKLGKDRVSSIFNDTNPDVLICRTPHFEVLRQARARRIKTLPCFADIFQTTGLRTALWHLRLRLVLSGSNFPCVANHSLNASRSVAASLWYPREHIVPWDWTRMQTSNSVKTSIENPQTPMVFFAGALTVHKGVGDCLSAIKKLHERDIHASMTFAGPGNIDHWSTEAKQLGIGDSVKFLGVIPNNQVSEQMRSHDIVVVPSRHTYAEGLPNTIFEGLASRSPLIISDHPAFQDRLKPKRDCLVFCASDPVSLADNIARLCKDQKLYTELSNNSQKALEDLYVGLEWSKLIDTFLNDPDDSSGWVERNSLKALKL
jgi:glycosyltransferase involved in cell wall biosynthesis